MEVLPFLGYSLYQMFHMFIFWSIIGWAIEVCDLTLETGEYQNRGFLNGPMCPIYGFGVLMVVIFLRPLSHTLLPLFLTSMVICTFFEFAVGIGMEKMFNNRWWDYSNHRFNYKGYICLKISILWGLGCVFVVKVVHPIVEKYVNWLPQRIGLIFIIFFSVLIVIDVISSIIAVNNLNARLKRIDEISKLMLKSAVIIGENLSYETLEIKCKYDKFISAADCKANAVREKYDNSKQDLKELLEKFTNISDDKIIIRLLKSFPNMHSLKYDESLAKIKSSFKNKMIKTEKTNSEVYSEINLED